MEADLDAVGVVLLRHDRRRDARAAARDVGQRLPLLGFGDDRVRQVRDGAVAVELVEGESPHLEGDVRIERIGGVELAVGRVEVEAEDVVPRA